MENNNSGLSRISMFRPLWWILQGIIVAIWQCLLLFVLTWQFFYILFTGKTHAWSKEFTAKYINHVIKWTQYTFWTIDEQPQIIEY